MTKTSILFTVILWIILFSAFYCVLGCTDNARSKSFGGTSEIVLEPCERLVNITWKDSDMWMLLNKNCEQKPKEYNFKAKSSWGVFEGNVKIIER